MPDTKMARGKKEIILLLATKHNLPIKTVEKIVGHQFKYVKKIMEEGDFETIRLPYFGKFSVKPGRIKNLNKKKNGISG